MNARVSEIEAEQAARAVIVKVLQSAFEVAVQGDVAAPAIFAPRRAQQTVAGIIFDAIDGKDDFTFRAMRILADAAAGRGVQGRAEQLLKEAGAHWADRNADFFE